jgi:hypothetical protein
VKAGGGNYANTLFEAYVNNSRSRNQAVGIHLKHFGSLGGGINDYAYNGFSNNQASVYGKKFLRKHLVEGSLNYDYNTLHYYGFQPKLELYDWSPKGDKKDIRQRFSKIGATTALQSFLKDSAKADYKINFHYYNLTDRFGVMENYGKTDVSWVKNFKPQWGDFLNNELLVLNGSVDYNHYQWADSSFLFQGNAGNGANGIFKLEPKIVSSGKKFKLDLGMNIHVQASHTATFHFYPNASMKYNVLDEMLIPYVGISGGIQRNNFGTLSQQNPFILSQIALQNTNKAYDFYGGVRGAFSSLISFNLMASISELRGMPLFVNHDVTELTFQVVYDTVKVTNLGGEIGIHQSNKMNILIKGNYYIYEMKNELAPWHLPNLRVGLTGFYDLQDKLVLKADLFYNSLQVARTFDDVNGKFLGNNVYSTELPGYFDANLGVEYRYSKKLSAFININNIASANYYKWNNYPSQSINILGGLTYSFWER